MTRRMLFCLLAFTSLLLGTSNAFTSTPIINRNVPEDKQPALWSVDGTEGRLTTGVNEALSFNGKRGQVKCDISLKGNGDHLVTVSIKCGKQLIESKAFNYYDHPEQSPSTEEMGFRLFAAVNGILYAIVTDPGSQLVISSLEVTSLTDLGALFMVEEASLTIKKGVIRDIQDMSITGVIHARAATVVVSELNCTDVSAKEAGFLVAEESTLDISNSMFERITGEERSQVFFIYDHSTLNIVDTHLSGSLPHSPSAVQGRNAVFSVPANFEDIAADAGIAFVSGESELSATMMLMEHFPSIKGTIYLEKNSKLKCARSKLYNNLALYGGAIYAKDSFVSLESVHAKQNSASLGGAVLLQGSSFCELDDVDFDNNLAIQGGAIYLELSLCNSDEERDTIAVTNCTFEKNRATDVGGGIYSTCVSLDVQQCVFKDNTAFKDGGGVFANLTKLSNFKKTDFIHNSALNGGAIYIQADVVQGNLSIHEAMFDDNSAVDGDGGAVYFFGSSSLVNISSTLFHSNSAVGSGGALFGYQMATVTVDNTSCYHNIAEKGSGASLCIVDTKATILTGTKFRNGSAGDHGGDVFIQYAERVELNSVDAVGSTAAADGGFLALFSVRFLTIDSSNIDGCKAGGTGGSLSFKEPLMAVPGEDQNPPSAEVVASNFTRNSARRGGGIYIVFIDTLVFVGCHLDDNSAVNGGGLYAWNMTVVAVSYLHARGNFAESEGGAMHLSKLQHVFLLSSSLEENRAGTLGGAVLVEATPNITISGSNFTGNLVGEGSGGALGVLEVELLSISDHCSFLQNQADQSGGAVLLNKPQQIVVSETQFLANRASKGDGGALYFLPDTSDLDNGDILERSLSIHELEEEGEFEDIPSERIRFITVNFKDNEAGRDGGAVYLDSLEGTVYMDNTYFESCRAIAGKGGCIYLTHATSLKVLQGDFEKNFAGIDGGCFFLIDVPDVNIDKSKFDACVASDGKGGAVYLQGAKSASSVVLSALDGVLTANRAAFGGAYFITEIDELKLDESKFYENAATNGSGGAMNILKVPQVHMLDLRMDKNTATRHCGAFCLKRVKDVNISGFYTGNKARGLDGGVACMHRVNHAAIRGGFSSNMAHFRGGALQFSKCDVVDIIGVQFTSNIARQGRGGGLNAMMVKTLSLLNTNFTQNEGSSGGGLSLIASNASYVSVSSVFIIGSLFSQNKADNRGGGLAVFSERREPANLVTNQTASLTVEVNSTLFDQNKARHGGGVAILAGDVRFQGSNFTGNDANRNGGALFLDNQFFLIIINDTLIARNKAHKGGAMAISCPTNVMLPLNPLSKKAVIVSGVQVNFTMATVSHNEAQRRDDGALVVCDDHSVFMANVTFVHNFRNLEWFFYIIFVVGGYGILFFFLLVSYYTLARWNREKRAQTIVVYDYDEIGEHDPEAELVPFFMGVDPAASLSEDEPIIAPTPAPGTQTPEPGVQADLDRSHLPMHAEESEIQEEVIEDPPLLQSKYPDHV